jgi:hypothetical protein
MTFGILSTYPPTACGLATFSAALARGLRANGAEVGIVRIADESGPSPHDVVGELLNGSPRSVAAAARTLNDADVAIVQHEYGLYGGRDGDEVVDILGDLEVPVHRGGPHRPPTPHRQPAGRAGAGRRSCGPTGGHDRGCPRPPARRVRRRSRQGGHRPARCRGARHVLLHRSDLPPPAAHLGPHRPGQGDRACHRRHGLAPDAAPPSAVPRGRPDASEGACSQTARCTATR